MPRPVCEVCHEKGCNNGQTVCFGCRRPKGPRRAVRTGYVTRRVRAALADVQSQLEHWRRVRDSSHDNKTVQFVAMTYVDVLLRVQKRLLR